MQVNGPDGKEQERRRLRSRVIELEGVVSDLMQAFNPTLRSEMNMTRMQREMMDKARKALRK